MVTGTRLALLDDVFNSMFFVGAPASPAYCIQSVNLLHRYYWGLNTSVAGDVAFIGNFDGLEQTVETSFSDGVAVVSFGVVGLDVQDTSFVPFLVLYSHTTRNPA